MALAQAKPATQEAQLCAKIVPVGTEAEQEERMVEFLKWLDEKCSEVNAREERRVA